jgi:hypothetical protein
MAALVLGAGRGAKDDVIDPSVGLVAGGAARRSGRRRRSDRDRVVRRRRRRLDACRARVLGRGDAGRSRGAAAADARVLVLESEAASVAAS